MVYYELIEKTQSHTNKIVPQSELKMSPRNFEAYCSLFGYDQDIVEFVKLHDTVSGYNGDYYLRTFFFDIDCKDLAQAQDSAMELIKRLNIAYKINPNHVIIYFSGGKGFHIGLSDKLFGGFDPSNDLPDKTKFLAYQLSGDIPNVDLKIYNKNRFFRLPNSKHADTGLYKIPLSFDELNLKSIDEIVELAKEPRTDFKLTFDFAELLPNESLLSAWLIIKNKPTDREVQRDMSGRENLFQLPTEGERNDILFKQACKLFKFSKLKFDDILQIIASINHAVSPPLDDKEVMSLVRSAEKYKTDEEEEKKVNYRFFVDYIPPWLEYISPTKRKLTLCFSEIDEDQRFKLNGKLIAIMGKGGSKKTIFAGNIILENIVRHKARCLFSQMDMGDLELMSRFINHIADGGDISASEMLERLEKEKPGQARVWLENKPVVFYSDNLIVSSQPSMQAADYDKVIEDITRRHGKIDILVVDSLSKMGGVAGETERYSDNTRDLKALAIKWDLCVILLCHVTKACEKWYRDCSKYVRGSEKILDDCDFYISMSQIIDTYTSSAEAIEFIQEKGVLHYYNKRGTGKTLKKVFDFEPLKLRMKESTDNPSAYEFKPPTSYGRKTQEEVPTF